MGSSNGPQSQRAAKSHLVPLETESPSLNRYRLNSYIGTAIEDGTSGPTYIPFRDATETRGLNRSDSPRSGARERLMGFRDARADKARLSRDLRSSGGFERTLLK